ncbi:MAG: hypothetical protein EBQ80_00500 [Proteobacteria bacterium]|nr:hypothetical protein [Pseudomonadota bacterium]
MVRPCALPYVLPAVLLAGCAHAAVAPQPLQMAYYQPSGNMSDAPAALTGTPIAETPSVLTPGKVLLVRTQEAAPQATAEELKAAMLQQATVAAQTEARHIAIQTSTQLAQKFEQLATRTDALLNQTSAVLAANTTTQQAVTAQLNASSQLGESVKQTTTAQLAQLATTTQQKITELEQSSLKPADVQSIATTVATQTAAVTANKTATEVATQVATQTAEQTAAATATQTAEATVANAVPQFRALALQSVKDSEGYIRTIARNTVQDDADPAIQQAMANAARNVIVKDDKVVFAIRKAVAEGLVQAGLTSPTTKLGNDVTAISPAAGPAITVNGETLDATRLGISPLLPPTGITQTGDNPNLATLSPAAGRAPSLTPPRNRTGLLNLRDYRVVIHEDNRTLEQLIGGVLQKAEPYTGPWQIKWKISDENKDILTEKFSLDVETTFEEFASYLAQYLLNDRGIKLSFNLFDSERIIVVSD